MRDEGLSRAENVRHELPVTSHSFEEGLQNALRRHRVERALETRAACTGRTQGPSGVVRGQVLVDECRLDAETSAQALRETAREMRHGVHGVVRVRRQPYHQKHRTPFVYDAGDGAEPAAVVQVGD